MKLIIDDAGETLTVRAEHFNEEQLLFLVRNALNDHGLMQLKFQTIRDEKLRNICAIDVDTVHLPFTPGDEDCEVVRGILDKKRNDSEEG